MVLRSTINYLRVPERERYEIVPLGILEYPIGYFAGPIWYPRVLYVEKICKIPLSLLYGTSMPGTMNYPCFVILYGTFKGTICVLEWSSLKDTQRQAPYFCECSAPRKTLNDKHVSLAGRMHMNYLRKVVWKGTDAIFI